MKLDDPESYLAPLTQVSITMVYRPWQESDKAEKKKTNEIEETPIEDTKK